jgi:Uma2 family endonuclease
MGTKTLMSVDEYLHTTFDGADREYLDGEVVERNMGNRSHSWIQKNFIFRLELLAQKFGYYVYPEMRHRVTASRFRIPDIAVFEHRPPEEVPILPPLVAIEVLSPDDRASYMIPKLEEYQRWGVKHIWVADPEERKFFTYGATGLHDVAELSLPEYGITLTKEQIFDAA